METFYRDQHVRLLAILATTVMEVFAHNALLDALNVQLPKANFLAQHALLDI